jgi:hypothetical protein
MEGPLQSLCFFYADRKFKMAATAGHRLTEEHSMNIHVQCGFNNICSFGEEGI